MDRVECSQSRMSKRNDDDDRLKINKLQKITGECRATSHTRQRPRSEANKNNPKITRIGGTRSLHNINLHKSGLSSRKNLKLGGDLFTDSELTGCIPRSIEGKQIQPLNDDNHRVLDRIDTDVLERI